MLNLCAAPKSRTEWPCGLECYFVRSTRPATSNDLRLGPVRAGKVVLFALTNHEASFSVSTGEGVFGASVCRRTFGTYGSDQLGWKSNDPRPTSRAACLPTTHAPALVSFIFPQLHLLSHSLCDQSPRVWSLPCPFSAPRLLHARCARHAPAHSTPARCARTLDICSLRSPAALAHLTLSCIGDSNPHGTITAPTA